MSLKFAIPPQKNNDDNNVSFYYRSFYDILNINTSICELHLKPVHNSPFAHDTQYKRDALPFSVYSWLCQLEQYWDDIGRNINAMLFK